MPERNRTHGTRIIVGRTVSPKGGVEFRWRADPEDRSPVGDNLERLKAAMRFQHGEVFGDRPVEVEVVSLPAWWGGEKLYKHPRWSDDLGRAQDGRYGIHVEDEDDA